MRLKQLLGVLPNAGASAAITTLFFVFFVGLCWFVYRRDRRGIYERLERLPLEGDER